MDAVRFDRQRAREALARGELVRLLAEVTNGRMTPDEFVAILDERDEQRPLRRLARAILGR